MRARLQNELDTFLQEYSISGFLIFRDWILKAAGLSDECQKYCHFYGDEEDEENLWFRAKGLNEEDSRKLLMFLKQDALDGNKIFLKEDVVFEQLLPDFISHMKKEDSLSLTELTKYQLMSKDTLERKLVMRISSIANKLLQYNLGDEETLFVKQLTDLKAASEQYLYWGGDHLSLATQISSTLPALKEWMNLPVTMTDLNQLSETVSVFERLNRANERSLNKKFVDEVEEFLSTYCISGTKCEIFEHMLLEIAEINYRPGENSRFNFNTNNLRTLFIFSHEDDMGEEAEKFIQFFHDSGDVSALIKAKKQERDKNEAWEFSDDDSIKDEVVEEHKSTEQPSYRNYSEGIKVKSSFSKPFSITPENPPIVYEFSVDTEICRTVIWPKVKQHIELLARDNPQVLAPYQQACKSIFNNEESSKSNHCADSFFKVATSGFNEADALRHSPINL